jgi:superfamily II DNA or RNA helicase
VKLRAKQTEVLVSVQENVQIGARFTRAYLEAGLGKTAAAFAAADWMKREGLIDAVAYYVPRTNLAGGVDRAYRGFRRKGAFGAINEYRHITNDPPFTNPNDAFVHTYQSGLAAPTVHIDWARRRAGRFLLVLDEAQMLGDEAGIKSTAVIDEIARYAFHILPMTATPRRSDGRALWGFEYGDEDEKGWRPLIDVVRGTYADGLAERPPALAAVQFDLLGADVRWNAGESEEGLPSEDVPIEEWQRGMADVLRRESIWRPYVQKVVDRLVEIRHSDEGGVGKFRALINCVDRNHARAVYAWLCNSYKHLRFALVISDEADAQRQLLEFQQDQSQAGDVLIAVQMAYIGYDCPAIKVIGWLSPIRYEGYLRQGCGRGWRFWPQRAWGSQILYFIAPKDRRMVAFAEKIMEEQEDGLRRGREGHGPGEPKGFVEDAWANGQDRAQGVHALSSLTEHEFAWVLQQKAAHGITAAETGLAVLIRASGGTVGTVEAPAAEHGTEETFREARARIGRECERAIKSFMYQQGWPPDRDGWREKKQLLTAVVADKCEAINACRSLKELERRLLFCRSLVNCREALMALETR